VRGLCGADGEAEAGIAEMVELEGAITATQVDPLTLMQANNLPMTGPRVA
jgi:hypothetical protein